MKFTLSILSLAICGVCSAEPVHYKCVNHVILMDAERSEAIVMMRGSFEPGDPAKHLGPMTMAALRRDPVPKFSSAKLGFVDEPVTFDAESVHVTYDADSSDFQLKAQNPDDGSLVLIDFGPNRKSTASLDLPEPDEANYLRTKASGVTCIFSSEPSSDWEWTQQLPSE